MWASCPCYRVLHKESFAACPKADGHQGIIPNCSNGAAVIFFVTGNVAAVPHDVPESIRVFSLYHVNSGCCIELPSEHPIGGPRVQHFVQ